jgi:hypothetical protein
MMRGYTIQNRRQRANPKKIVVGDVVLTTHGAG